MWTTSLKIQIQSTSPQQQPPVLVAVAVDSAAVHDLPRESAVVSLVVVA